MRPPRPRRTTLLDLDGLVARAWRQATRNEAGPADRRGAEGEQQRAAGARHGPNSAEFGRIV